MKSKHYQLQMPGDGLKEAQQSDTAQRAEAERTLAAARAGESDAAACAAKRELRRKLGA